MQKHKTSTTQTFGPKWPRTERVIEGEKEGSSMG